MLHKCNLHVCNTCCRARRIASMSTENARSTSDASTSGRRLPRAQRESQLIACAQKLFASKGYQGTAIEDIARAAGVTRPMVYNYFGDKDGIYLACVKNARSQFELCMLEAVSRANSARERLQAGFDAYFSFVEQQGAAWDVLFGGGAAIAGPAEQHARDLRFATVDKIALLLEQNLPNGYPAHKLQAFGHTVSGAAEQLAKWWRHNPQISRHEVVTTLMAICWTGLDTLSQIDTPAQ